MPAPISADTREAVKAHAITHGLRPAAAAFNLPVGTLAAWSARDPQGPWCPKAVQTPKQAITVQPRANTANTPSEAARNSLETLYSRTRLNMAKTADKGFRKASQQKGEAIIATADKLKSLAGVAAVAHPALRETAQTGASTVVNIAFLGIPSHGPSQDMPTIEQEGG